MKQTTAKTNYRETNSQLISQIREGGRRGQKAREQLILQNQDLVRSIVYGYKRANSKIDENDLLQQGLYGLIKAIDNFDKEPECFNPYLSIEGYILNYLHKDRTIKTDYRQDKKIEEYEAAYKYDSENDSNEKTYEYEYEDDTEIGVHLKPLKIENETKNEEGETINRMENIIIDEDGEEVSIDETIKHGNIIEEGTINRIDDKAVWDRIEKYLSSLNTKEKELIYKYFGLGEETEHTLEQIAQKEGVTRMAIFLRKETILKKIKKYLE